MKNTYDKQSAKYDGLFHLKICLIFGLIAIMGVNTQPPASPTYQTIPDNQKIIIRAGTKQVFNSLKSSSDPPSTFTITYATIVPSVPAQTKINAITSVSSFDCLASTEFSFNSTFSSITFGSFNVQFQNLGNSYLNRVQLDYLVVAWENTYSTVVNVLYSDCFLTSDLAVVTTKRSQSFDKQTLGSTVANGSQYTLQSFITGLKFFNNKDVAKKVSVNSQIKDNTNYITQEVTVTQNTILQWICLGTVVVDRSYGQFYQQKLPFEMGTFILDRDTASIDTNTFPANYLTKYDQKDNKFFGLIELDMKLGKPYQIVKFFSDVPNAVENGFQSLAVGAKMAYFFIAQRTCPVAYPLYSIATFDCWDNCPDFQAKDSALDICAACHFSCLKCSGLQDNQCTQCDANDNRGGPNGGKCQPLPGFVEKNVEVCPRCSVSMPLCDTCTPTQCLTCLSPNFQLKADLLGCECPPGQYYVALSDVCAPYPGCEQARKNTNFISCITCDASNNFILNASSACQCKDNYTLSGNTCIDICRDGINPFVNDTNYCDDGNADDGDGCSANCGVQANFGCFNPPNNPKSFCSPVKTFNLKFLYAQRVVNENAGNFYFEVTPMDPQLAQNGFTYYVQTSIPHTTAIGVYDPVTSILRIKILYTQSIEDQNHDIHITLDPYKMSVQKASFTLKASGVNYDLKVEQNPSMFIILWYVTASVSGIVVISSLVMTFVNYKIAAVELLLSSQLVYLSLLAWMDDNLSLYPLTSLKFLAGYNQIQPFEINKQNANTPFLLSSYTFAEFLLNFNAMAGVIALVIFIIIPLKINVWFRTFQRNRYTSPEMQQKLVTQEPTTSLSEMSARIKTAQFVADTYLDRVYFGFSLIVFLPIVLYFSVQLGFIGKVGRYELSSFANIMLSILLLMLDFCFFILVFQDTDKKLKMFNFGSKKLKSYPNRLMMFYFATCCLFTIVLLSEFTFYVLAAMTLLIGIYVVVQNPYEKFSLEYFDSVSKPIISLICQAAVKATTFFSTSVIFIPIIVDALILISTIVTIIRVVRVKLSRAEAAKKMLEDAENDDENDFDFQKNLKNSNDSEQLNKNNKKINGKFDKDLDSNSIDQKIPNNQYDDSAGQLNKDDSPVYNHQDEIGQQDEDQLTRIKRSLRQDLKKRRGIVQKANDQGLLAKSKKSRSKKSKDLNFTEDSKQE